jgi:two-component system sensor histidine kinase VicK
MTLGTRWRDMAPEQIDTFLGMIHRRCDGLQKLIDKILTGARLEAGREIPMNLEPIDVAGVLRRIAAEFSDVSPRHEIVVVAGEAWATADPVALDQVLGLLTENALKYSPDGGQVRLEAERRGSQLLVRVEDHGVGMNAEAIEHAFEPYYRASRGNAQRAGGVGLGLSIARHLVRRQGGDISVVSAEGIGSVFTFTLHAAEAPATVSTPEAVSR